MSDTQFATNVEQVVEAAYLVGHAAHDGALAEAIIPLNRQELGSLIILLLGFIVTADVAELLGIENMAATLAEIAELVAISLELEGLLP